MKPCPDCGAIARVGMSPGMAESMGLVDSAAPAEERMAERGTVIEVCLCDCGRVFIDEIPVGPPDTP